MQDTTYSSPEFLDPAHPAGDPRPVPPRSQRVWMFATMAVMGLVSLVASFVLSIDALKLASDPNADLACAIDAVFDCAKVGTTWQAEVFGFPNAFIGIATSAIIITLAVAGMSGTRFPRWFMVAAHVAFLVGLVFAYWMLWHSTYVIGALCIWCLTIGLATTVVFWLITAWNFAEHNHYFSARTGERLEALQRGGWVSIGFMVWLAVVIILELVKWVPHYI